MSERHRTGVPVLLAAAIGPLAYAATVGQARELSFEERVAAQAAIERVVYAHQIGGTVPFEEAVPRPVLEARVMTYLKQSAALATVWKAPVTADDLRAELARMVRQTSMPERLRENFAALGHDPFLILECLVRPVLVDRLARARFDADATLHAVQSWDEWWPTASAGLDANSVVPVAPASPVRLEAPLGPPRDGTARLPLASLDTFRPAAGWRQPLSLCVSDDTWDNGSLALLRETREAHTAVWTGSRLIVWGGKDTHDLATGWIYDPATDSATPTSTIAAPPEREGHTAVWTGSRMIVWGGLNSFGPIGTGAMYEPLTDTWASISEFGAPIARTLHTAVWTGSRMVVWGGTNTNVTLQSGGRYDPATDTWTWTSLTGAPVARSEHTAVWTGSRMVAWGGRAPSAPTNSGGRYDPVADTWSTTTPSGAPAARWLHTAVWVGNRMMVWGGLTAGGPTQTGGRYDPAADAWAATSVTAAPSARQGHSAVWSGARMIVWGGTTAAGATETGGRYDPTTDAWVATSTTAAPAARSDHAAVWTGSFMVVWGGRYPVTIAGGRYALDQAVDDDGDGLSECAGDCDDADASVVGVPGDVTGLHWPSRDVLAWDSAAEGAGSGTTYDVMYGSLSQVSNLGTGPEDTCLANDLADLILADTSPDPPPAAGWFYLVRANHVCGKGRYETATDGSDRDTTACEPCDCCVANYSVDCSDDECHDIVCRFDSFCCEIAWDNICDGVALCICNHPCGGSCCDNKSNSDKGCSDQVCETTVLGLLSTCSYAWHAGCAELAREVCDCCVAAPPPASSSAISRTDHGGAMAGDYGH